MQTPTTRVATMGSNPQKFKNLKTKKTRKPCKPQQPQNLKPSNTSVCVCVCVCVAVLGVVGATMAISRKDFDWLIQL